VRAYPELGRPKTETRHQRLLVAPRARVGHAAERPQHQNVSGGNHLRPRVHVPQDDHIAAMAHMLTGT